MGLVCIFIVASKLHWRNKNEINTNTRSETMINELFKMCNGIEYTRDIPKDAEQYAKENGFIIIVGGSDDLMYCYGAKSYMTDYVEHGYGWDGNDLIDIDDKQLECEAKQIGLKIWWCGHISSKSPYYKLENYDMDKMGAFSYTVNDDIEFKNFTVFEDEKHNEVYCTGIIVKLPESFKPCMEEK